MSNMQQTSLLSFQSLNPTRMGQRQQQVYEAIDALQPCSDKQIATHTNIPYHTVAARRGELKQLVEYCKDGFQDGRKVRLYRLAAPNIPSVREYRAGLREPE